ncbi:MAG TPA: DUF1080 domain-containing protein, partial [Phnomibacter sp.]|nr:DUF1080 domain-containing protein [Phnomibacter sp.]
MSVKTTLAAALSLALCFSQCSPVARQKASQQWQPLFNGKDLTNWIVKIHGHETGDNYAQTFRADSGMIRVRYDGYQEFKDRFGHLFYHIPYGYYKLRFEYRFAQPWRTDAPGYTQLNSGVMFHAQDPRTILKEQDWPISVEFQLLAGLPDGQPRPTGNMCSPGTDVVF